MRRSIAITLVLAAALSSGAQPPPEPIVLVVAAEWPGPHAIDLPTLRRVYLDRQRQVEGARARALHMPAGSAIREAFSRTALGRPESRLERYWIEQALLGEGLPPREVSSAAAVLTRVRIAPGTIGYVARSELDALETVGIRTLAIERSGRRLAPDDSDYPLRFRASPPPPSARKPLGKDGADP